MSVERGASRPHVHKGIRTVRLVRLETERNLRSGVGSGEGPTVAVGNYLDRPGIRPSSLADWYPRARPPPVSKSSPEPCGRTYHTRRDRNRLTDPYVPLAPAESKPVVSGERGVDLLTDRGEGGDGTRYR